MPGRFSGAALLPFAVLTLSACGGGGGGGGPSLTLQLTPSSVAVSVLQGQTASFVTLGSVTGEVDGVVNVLIVDTAGVISPDVVIQQIGDDYQATFSTAATLVPNTYTGSIAIRLCGGTPPACGTEYGRADLAYTITVLPVPVPTVTGIAPTQSAAGGAGFTLSVQGSSFFPSSVVRWNGQPLATTYVSATELRATVNAAAVADGGTRAVTVFTPAPGGGTSGSTTHTVFNIVPSLAVVSPSLTAAGCGAFTLTAVGTGFVPSSVLNWQGSPLATTFVTATTLRATVPASLLASAGSRTVTVVSPAPGGGSSAGRSVTVSPAGEPTTQAVAYQVDAGHTGVASSLCPDSLADDPLWDVPVGGTASYPLIAGGRVFVTVASPAPSNETVLLALDANSGTVLWGPVVVAGDAGFYGRADAAFANGTVFVAANRDPALPVNVDNGARPGSVQAYSAATGTLLWRTAIEQNGSSTDVGGPVAANGRVYINVRTAVGTLQAFDQATGARQIVVSAGFGSARPPAVTADAVILSDPCGTAAFSPATGDPLWSQSEGCSTGAIGVPIIAGDAVYSATGGFGDPFLAYALADGSPLGGYTRYRVPAIRDGVSYGPTATGLIQATTVATGVALWSWPPNPGFGFQDVTPIVVNGLVFSGTASPGTLNALDAATGIRVWQRATGGTLPSGPQLASFPMPGLAAGENLLVVPTGTRLQAYRIGAEP